MKFKANIISKLFILPICLGLFSGCEQKPQPTNQVTDKKTGYLYAICPFCKTIVTIDNEFEEDHDEDPLLGSCRNCHADVYRDANEHTYYFVDENGEKTYVAVHDEKPKLY